MVAHKLNDSEEIERTEGGISPEDTLMLKAGLKDAMCALRHEKPRPAVNYVCQRFESFTGTIPVCEECLKKLQSDDWVLLFCVNCSMNLWIYKPDSKKSYHYLCGQHIKWMPTCPYCHREYQEQQERQEGQEGQEGQKKHDK